MESLTRVLKLGYSSFWRNRYLTLGATLLMTLTLTMVSVSVLLSFIIRDASDVIRSKIDLTIYFRDDTVADAKITSLADSIKNLSDVSGVQYIDKAQALEIFDRLPINEDVKAPLSLDNNPLPRSILVTTGNPDKIDTVAEGVVSIDTQKIVCSDCISLSKNKDVIDRIKQITNFSRQTSIVLSLFFGLIAIFNVMNIIRITITTRSDEIEIMRYVGASNLFVRGPFIIEGAIYGIVGTVLTTLFLILASYIISLKFGGSSTMFNLNIFYYIQKYLLTLVSIQLALGVVLGVVVSIFSIRRYLKI